MFLSRAMLTLAALSFSTVTAIAADCGPLKEIASIDMTSVPSGLVMVPVLINGTPERFLVNTGGGRSTITQTAITSLGLKTFDGNQRLITGNGNASRRVVEIDNFSLGTIQGKNIQLKVDPNPDLGSNSNLPVAGSLANDLMENSDFELNFTAGKLNYFSTDHCNGHVVYWTTDAPAILSYRTSGPGESTAFDNHIRFHVTVDGKNMLAVMATGTTGSSMSARAAGALYDLTIDAPNTVPLGTPDGDPNHRVFGYTFKTLVFGGVAVTNPHFRITPVVIGEHDPDNSFVTGSMVTKVDDNREPDVIIGMDVLRKLRIYVATYEHKLYITAAGPRSGQ
jgi:predicted aspartyl protease